MMRTANEPIGPALPYSANVDAYRLWVAADQSMTAAAWWCAAALVAAVLLLVLAPSDKGLNGIATLERLAPRVERAPVLAADTRETVGQLLARQHALSGSGNAALEARRQAAVERMTSALDAQQRAIAGR